MSSSLSFSVGDTLKGYELRELIAEGGQGQVYRAYQPVIDREVAIKVIRAEYANHPDFIRRFEAEAQVIARLEHLHIVPLYDFWREPNNACLVMRWMRSGSVRGSLKQHGPWTVHAVARALDQLASALTVAHRNMIVHRDLKPDNILLDDEDNVYLADFGIAKDIHPNTGEVAQRSSVGSPTYMAPEQFLEQPITVQTDIYSLGIVVYELLTGVAPFDAASTVQLAYKHIRDDVPTLQKYQALLSPSLNVVIWRATAKKPEARYPDVMTFARAFRQCATEHVLEPALYRAAVPGGLHDSAVTLALDEPVELPNPYKGLRAFLEGDAADFFGRETLIKQLLVQLGVGEPSRRFLALVGPSGSGKSSVLRAGLLPALRRGALPGSQHWFYSQIVPGASPLTNLVQGLMSIAPNPPAGLAEQLRQNQHGLVDVVKGVLPDDRSEYCLLIDQFEEVFTLVENEEERRWFLDSLCMAATREDSRIHVLITLRADFYDRPLLYAGFSDLMRSNTEVVIPLQARELEYAVVGPAQRAYLQFNPGLVGRIIADVIAQPGSLPLLQYALTELFERRQDQQLTHAAYEAIKGVTGALAQRAEDLYLSLSPSAQAAAEKMLLRLVALSEEGVPTRRRVLQTELLSLPEAAQEMRQVMEALGRYRLLTFDHHPHTRAPTIELAHETLLSAWGRLKDWVAANSDRLRIQRELNAATSEWERSGKDRSFLVTGARLARFESLCNEAGIMLTESEQAYLNTGITLRQRGVQRLRLFITSLVIALVIAFVLVGFAFQQRGEAEAARLQANLQANLSRSRELAATALSHLDELDLSLLLSIEALNAADTFEARSSLLTALQSQPMIEAFLPDTDSVRAIAFSPDGRLLATAGRSNQILLWDLDTKQRLDEPLTGHTGWINSLAFSPDGERLASASADGTIRIWDLTSRQVYELLGDAQAVLWTVVFSPDGTLVAAAGEDGRIQLWDAKTGQPHGTSLMEHDDIVYSLAFSPDGQRLASGSADMTVRLWNVTTGDLVHTFNDHNNWVLSVGFSPDGQRLASSGVDETIVIWDMQTYETWADFASGHQDYVRSLDYSFDGQILASSSQDGTIRLWDTLTNTLLQASLSGHQDGIWSVAFHPSSHQLASGAADGKVILWNLSAEQPFLNTRIVSTDPVTSLTFADDRLIYSSSEATTAQSENTGLYVWNIAEGNEQTVFSGQQGIITDLAYNPLTQQLVSSSTDGTLFLWDMKTMRSSGSPFARETTGIATVSFSQDGGWIASGDERGTVTLWNISSGEPHRSALVGHEDAILSLAFDPQQQLLASGSRDGTIRLWSVNAEPTSLATLEGHEDGVSSVAFSPDGQLLASGSYDRTTRIWDAFSHQSIGQPLNGQDEVWSVVFSPDGRIIASAGKEGTITLWDVNSDQLLGTPLSGHTDWITQLSFNPEGNLLASGSLDSQTLLWNFGMQYWAERACDVSNRNLSTEEWARYLSTETFRDTCAR